MLIDLRLPLLKLDALKQFIFNSIDGIEQPSLEDTFYKIQCTHEMYYINKAHSAAKSETIAITDHAYDAAKERLSMSRTSFLKLAEKAFVSGIRHSECAGNLKKFIDSKFLSQRTANNIRIYGQNVFIFSSNVLLTVYQIPNNLKKSASKINKSKAA